jgi:PAT family acetyl-CoA transporter-like MFS transporter 1
VAERGTMLELRRPDHVTNHGDIDGLSDLSEPLDGQRTTLTPVLSFLEKKNLLLLGTIYFIHAIPLQFSWITMPIILRQQLSYSDVGTFLISQYPYSWKAGWSPLVDGLHHPLIGRRKTWIVPSLVMGGAVLFWLAFAQDSLVAKVASGRPFAMAWLVLAWFMVMICCANIRIALDSWSINLLSPPNVHWASSIFTIGETAASLVSCTLFLGMTSLNSPKRETSKAGPANTRLFFGATAIAFITTAVLLLVGNSESDKAQKRQPIRKVYTIIWEILKLRHAWILMLVHVASMIGFITNDTIITLQLVKNNFSDFDLAVLAAVSLPFALSGSFLVAKAFQTRHPLHVWRRMFPWRLIIAFVSQLTILFVSRYPNSQLRWFIVVLPLCLSTFFSAAMWVAFIAFHAQVSDPHFGGIYMSVLATTLNIRYDTLQFLCTKAIGIIDGNDDLTKPSPLIDGYQIVNVTTVVLAIPIYWFFLRPATLYLQTIDASAWRIKYQGPADATAYEMVETLEDDEHHN